MEILRKIFRNSALIQNFLRRAVPRPRPIAPWILARLPRLLPVVAGGVGCNAFWGALVLAQSPLPPTVPEPGWGPWRPIADLATIPLDAGFSNMELGSYLEFEYACQETTGLAAEEVDYWFRIDRLWASIGTGTIETGCWYQGAWVGSNSGPATRSDRDWVDCLRVNADAGHGLVMRSLPTIASDRRGVVANGATVRPSYFPASITRQDGRDWLHIDQPMEAWISVGKAPTGWINLQQCHS